MRVLHVVPSFHPAYRYGGPITSVFQLCRHLAEAGCDVRVLTTDADGIAAVLDVDVAREVLLADKLKVRYCHRVARQTVSLSLLRLVLRYVRWADVVHLNAVYSFPTFPTLLAARRTGRGLLWSPRGAFQQWHGLRRRPGKRVWNATARVCAPTKMVMHATAEAEARDCARVLPKIPRIVIPNGVEVPAVTMESTAGTLAHGELRLLFLGRLDPIKGLENLFEACAILRRETSLGFRLSVAGTGDPLYVRTLQNRARRLSVEDHVVMVGEVNGDGKSRLLAESEVLVLPSFSENFGIVVAEALAHGLPVVASKGTPWAAIGDVGCGLWVDNSPASLARAIQSIAEMPRHEMGHRGRQWVRQEFGWGRIARDMMGAYAAVVREAGSDTAYHSPVS